MNLLRIPLLDSGFGVRWSPAFRRSFITKQGLEPIKQA
jgi:hypothetical protein